MRHHARRPDLAAVAITSYEKQIINGAATWDFR
jgi:hypothetical protein